MNPLKLIFCLIITLLLSSCTEDRGTYEIDALNGDTINRRDDNGRQGRWIVNNCCAKGVPGLTKSAPDSIPETIPVNMSITVEPIIFEIGNYVDNKRQGTWTFYNVDSTVNKTQEYKDDLPVRD